VILFGWKKTNEIGQNSINRGWPSKSKISMQYILHQYILCSYWLDRRSIVNRWGPSHLIMTSTHLGYFQLWWNFEHHLVKEPLPEHDNPSQYPKTQIGQGSFVLTWKSLPTPQGSARSRKVCPNMAIPSDALRLSSIKEVFP